MKASFFGGARNDKGSKEYLDSIKIGSILSNKGYTVKNGGYYGLMEAVSIGSGNSIGYVCRSFGNVSGNDYLVDKVIADDIYDRLRYLVEDSDVYIVQRGSVGTLTELFLTMDIMRKKDNKCKIILVGNFWNNIINSLFVISEEDLSMLTVIDDVNELENIL